MAGEPNIADVLSEVRKIGQAVHERIGSVEGVLGTVRQDVEALKERALLAQKTAADADKTARAAMVSHHDLETQVRLGHSEISAKVERMDAAQTPLLSKIESLIQSEQQRTQQRETEERARAAALEENRRQESIAVQSLENKRKFLTTVLTIMVPVMLAGLGAAQYVYAMRMRSDITDQVSQLRRAPQPVVYGDPLMPQPAPAYQSQAVPPAPTLTLSPAQPPQPAGTLPRAH